MRPTSQSLVAVVAPAAPPSPPKPALPARPNGRARAVRLDRSRSDRAATTRATTLERAERPAPLAASRRQKVDPRAALWRAFLRRRALPERNNLVETYQHIVREVVRRFAARLPRSVDPGDLETAGSFGLMAAVESFDPKRGVAFEKYCELRVRGAVLDELRSQDWLSRPWRARIERHKRACESLRGRLGREPMDDEVARELGLSAEEYALLMPIERRAQPHASIAGTTRGDDEPPGVEVLLSASNEEPPEERLSREDLLQLVAQKLTDQEYRIAYLRYWEDLSMREIGAIEGLSESRVCKIHAKLIDRLRDRFRAHVEA